MKVYAAMVNDRHTDPDVEVFANPDAAIAYAKHFAQGYCRHPEDYVEHDIEGWLFHARYSVEGDSVWVLEKEVR